ncbi:MAG: hypothetical protein DYG90_00680 [Chloroflexi bacterium CFX6]|nr:hypothetical protein [Chloroflexi bacterium CFX6]
MLDPSPPIAILYTADEDIPAGSIVHALPGCRLGLARDSARPMGVLGIDVKMGQVVDAMVHVRSRVAVKIDIPTPSVLTYPPPTE